MSIKGMRGVTLVELIVFVVILGVALAGILAIFVNTTRSSADPLMRKQGIAVAESLLEEVLSVPLTCPAGATCQPVTPSNRTAIHAITDYNGLNLTPITKIGGPFPIPVPNLNNYTASVTVASTPLNGAPGYLITITVTHTPSGQSVTLTGWRGNL